MIYCRNCGKELSDNSAFCTGCGAPLQQAQQPPYAPMTYNMAPAYAPPTYAKPATQHTVLNSYLGVILLFMLFIAFLFTGLGSSPYFLTPQNLSNMFRSFAIMLPLALSAALTMRAKGVDLSVGSMLMLSQIMIAKTLEGSGSWVVGLVIALLVCAAVGAANGVLTVYLKLPALAVTAVMFFVVFGICRLLANMPIVATDSSLVTLGNSIFGVLLFSLICIAGAVALIAFTSLGSPIFGRDKKKEPIHVLAYIVGAIFAAFSGLLLLARIQMAVPFMGYNYSIFASFVACAVASSRLLNNRFAPVPVALGATLIWVIVSNVLILLSVDSYTQLIMTILITAIFAVFAFINWSAARKALPKAH